MDDAREALIKAIKDGIVRAQIVADDSDFNKEPYVKFGDYDDYYRSIEPQQEFDARIKELLELYNQAVKALRYPDTRNPEVESIEEQRKREQLVGDDQEEDDDDEDDEEENEEDHRGSH